MLNKIEEYCDKKKMNFSARTYTNYTEFEFNTYTNEDIQAFKDIIEDKGVVKEEYECVGTDDIKRSLKIYLTKEAE